MTSAWESLVGLDARREVGDRRDPEAAHAACARGDDFDDGGHAHRVHAQPLEHADFGGGLVAGAEQAGVHPFVERRPSASSATSRASVAEPWIIGIGHVREALVARQHGPEQRVPEGEIHLIGDQHERAARKGPPDPAGRIGEDDGLNAQRAEDPDRQRAGIGAVTLVHVKAPALRDDGTAPQDARHQLATMSRDGGLGKAGDLAIRNPNGVGDVASESAQPGAQDDRNRRRPATQALAYRGSGQLHRGGAVGCRVTAAGRRSPRK